MSNYIPHFYQIWLLVHALISMMIQLIHYSKRGPGNIEHYEVEIIWTEFCRKHFQKHFMELTGFRNPTMHLFYIPQCTIQNRNVHISVLNVALLDMKLVDCEISEVSLLCFCCSIQISLMYVPRALIYNMPILVQIMALCQTVIVFVSTRHYVNQCWPTIYASLCQNVLSNSFSIQSCSQLHVA